MRYKGFTRIPHYLLDTPCDLTPHERCTLFCVYRQTAGYNRQSHRMSYSDLKKMSGVAGMSRICHSLADKGKFELSDYRKGGSYIFTIPLPITSGKHPVDMSSPPPSPDVNTPSHDVNTSRGAIDSSIDNTIDNIREGKTLSSDLINEMKSKYPEKDIDQAQKSFLIYPHHQGKNWSDVVLTEKFEKWCAAEKPSHKKFISQFKLDSCGFPMGWCHKCNVSAFYQENELYGDSKCCNSKILPNKPL